MKTIKNWIPNIITLGNLTCGMLACYIAVWLGSQVDYKYWYFIPSIWIFGAAVLDFFDGFAARVLKVHSELGEQLDSLADMVSFGVAPALIIMGDNMIGEYSYLGFLIGIFACIRLAKFNIDTRQSDSFLGLPVPSVGLVIAALPFVDKSGPLAFMVNPWVVAGLVVVLCLLMISEIPLLALKFKTFGLKENFYRYAVIVMGAAILIIFKIQGLPLVILGYVLISLMARKRPDRF